MRRPNNKHRSGGTREMIERNGGGNQKVGLMLVKICHIFHLS